MLFFKAEKGPFERPVLIVEFEADSVKLG